MQLCALRRLPEKNDDVADFWLNAAVGYRSHDFDDKIAKFADLIKTKLW